MPPTGRSSDDLEMNSSGVRRGDPPGTERLPRRPRQRSEGPHQTAARIAARCRADRSRSAERTAPTSPAARSASASSTMAPMRANGCACVRMSRSLAALRARSAFHTIRPSPRPMPRSCGRALRRASRWTLVDLQSSSGTFVRIGAALLRPNNEIIVGSGRYRFEAGAAASRSAVPSLVEVSPAGPVKRIALTQPEYWLGRDAKLCAIARPDDAFVNARHARLFAMARGSGTSRTTSRSTACGCGITEPMPLNNACQFRMGEQRFLFRVT